MKMPPPALSVCLAFLPVQLPAQDLSDIFVTAPGARISNLPDSVRGRSRASIPDSDGQFFTRLGSAQQMPWAQGIPELSPGILSAARRINQDPEQNGAIISLNDGRTFLLRQQAGVFSLGPMGGPVGPLPPRGPRNPVTPRIENVLPIRVLPEGGLYTGSFSGELPGRTSIPNTGRPTFPCGLNTAASSSHCALPTVELVHTDPVEHGFCTGVVVSERHVVTAAHCLCDDFGPDDTLRTPIRARMGSGDTWVWLDFADSPHRSFPGYFGGMCNEALGAEVSAREGDVAVMTLAPDALGNARAAFAADFDADELSRMIAPLGEFEAAIWEVPTIGANLFATWGFGIGPLGNADGKRALDYPLSDIGPCNMGVGFEPVSEGTHCPGVQDAIFHDPQNGLCAGDSGSGVFKPVEGSLPDGLAPWALLGIVSGTLDDGFCFDPDFGELQTHLRRNIVRLDTPKMRDWLAQEIGDQLVTATVRMNFDLVERDN